MATMLGTLIYFIVALVISTIIIYAVTALFREERGIGTALLAALIGTVIYTIVYFFFGTGFLPAVLAGIVWLLALMGLYKLTFLRALATALVVWVVAVVVGFFLPTLGGPF